MSSILEPLVERIRLVPPAVWEAMAIQAGAARTLPRKLASRDRENPRVGTIQPLIDFFADVDAGKRSIPSREDAPGIVAAHVAEERRKEKLKRRREARAA